MRDAAICIFDMTGKTVRKLPVSSGMESVSVGGFYDAPVVMVKQGNNVAYYNILRDHLGSVTHVVNSTGTVMQELSYDAWGRLRSPSDYTPYTPADEPEPYLGRGYCGHEHLTGLGLINMNARLYDPLLGRFLSPDPYVQAPEHSQSFWTQRGLEPLCMEPLCTTRTATS